MESKVMRVKKGNKESLFEIVSEDGEKWTREEGKFADEIYFENENLLKIINMFKKDGYKILEVVDGTLDEYLRGKVTSKQKYYIHDLVRKIGWSDEEYRSFLYENFKVHSSKELTKEDASLLIKKLINIKDGFHEIDYSNLPEIEPEV